MKKKLLSINLLLVLALLASNAFAQATFTAKTDFALPTASSGAMYLTSADLNNDGKPDLITANQNQNGITIFFNTTVINSSTPSFAAGVDFLTGTACHSVAAGDINGDGLIDLVAVNTTSATASVYLNLTVPGASTPTLSSKTDFTTGSNPYSVKLSDINGDGKLDIVCANQTAATFGVFLNTTATGASTPTFSAIVTFTTAAGPTHLAVGDLNGDGKPDVVVPNNTAGTISVFFNTTTTGASTPTFTAKTDYTAGSTAWCVCIGDINLDGKPDIACANRGASMVSVFINTTATGDAAPSFGAATNLSVGSTPFFVNVADINNDGLPDILTGSRGAASFSVYLNTTTPGAAAPTFAAISTFTTASQPYLPVVADYNGDGKQDVAIPNGVGNSVSVFLNTTGMGASSPSFSARTDFATNDLPFSNCSVDFNGDGKPDLACTNASSNNMSVFLNTTSPGAATPSFSAKTDFVTGGNPRSLKSGDFNGDGEPDLVCADNTSNNISVFLNTTIPGAATSSFTLKTDFVSGTGPDHIAVGDLNGDGKLDIASSNNLSNNLSVFLNTTTPGALTPTLASRVDFSTDLSPVGICIKDINSDGKPDLICVNSTASGTVSVFLNTTTPGALVPTFSARTDFACGSTPYAICAGDFNGDGKIDLACTYVVFPNGISIFLNTTSPGASTPSLSRTDLSVAGSTRGICTSDVNGDGKTDLACTNYSSSSISVFLNTTTPGASTPAFSTNTNYTAGVQPFEICAADINLDGKPDLACVNLSVAGPLSVFLNTAILPLPVELASFTSSVSGNNVSLSWNTVQEENNSGFDIERSSFGTGWNKVGFVNGSGTISTPRNYSYTDNALNSGRYNYRLKQIDYNGNFKYYDLSGEVIIGIPGKFALSQNYPNPFNPVTNINYSIPSSNFVSLKIFDISGREMMDLVNEKQEAGYYTVNFNASAFSSGTYFYKLSSDNFSEVKKMMVVK